MITAPYNFVPLNKNIFYPDWDKKISHDVPFEDGESGSIDISIKTMSPIYIQDSQSKEYFSNFNGHYFIPSTSIKGMIKSILEIMSFSKINMVDDKTYAVRDLRNKKLYMNHMKPQKIFCGWLKKDKDKYIVENCGVPGRISHRELDKVFNMKFAQKFRANFNQKGTFKNEKKFKTAEYKYSLINKQKLTIKFDYDKKLQQRELYKIGSEKKGTIVFTGQASARKDSGGMGDGKGLEFIFFNPTETIELTEKIYENFKFAYFDERTTEPKESPDWKHWKKNIDKGGRIPVFFQTEKDNKNKTIISHLGLSYLYKLPYKNSIYKGIYDVHYDDKLDLTQVIFGHTENDNALKGRVQFSHFKAENNDAIKALNPRTETLGTPRASYYPTYISQKGNTYSTYMDDNFIIAGRKRYPIHKNSPNENNITYNPKSTIGTSFRPLKDDIEFRGKLRYHNLKKEELGAILSALTFHNINNTYHNIGMAKSLGYGKIKIDIIDFDIKPYIEFYEKLMMNNITEWKSSNELMELFTMASEQNNKGNSSLEYMSLPNFANVKKGTEFLKRYSELDFINKVYLEQKVNEKSKFKKQLSQQSIDSISRNMMKKAIKEYWHQKYNTMYHRNQIKEFLSNKGFTTTPLEQRELYELQKDNKNFVSLCKIISLFEFENMDEQMKEKLYQVLIKV